MAPSQGNKIRTTLNEILDWCRKKARTQVPGEGGERLFRNRLKDALLQNLFGWPPEFIFPAERFDLRLLNEQDDTLIYIETKEPEHIASENEYQRFFARLRQYSTLRHAYFTNGSRWERFDIEGELPASEELSFGHFEEVDSKRSASLFSDLESRKRIGKYFEWILFNPESASQTEEFFAPLQPARYLDLSQPVDPSRHRQELSKDRPDFIESFSEELRDEIAAFQVFFVEIFPRLREGEMGAAAAGVCRELFQQWCERSYVVPPETLHRRVERLLAANNVTPAQLSRLFATELGFPADASQKVAESIFAEQRKKSSTPETRKEMLWPLYESAIRSYAVQTAHVYVARLLLYRIGEDQEVFDTKISGIALQELLAPPEPGRQLAPRGRPVTFTAIEALRNEMTSVAPTVYESGEFDWWRVEHPELLKEAELERLQRVEQEMDVANRRLLRALAKYRFSRMDLDIWRDIYQHYLPEEERQRLGGFYTPQELVDLALDYAKYQPTLSGLCQRTLIDLSSGSGAFIVSALQRLVAHLQDKSQKCHLEAHARDLPPWEQARRFLEIIANNVHAIDIHPFASFLTYINFLFVVLPFYVQARQGRRSFLLDVNIFSSDSLMPPGENARIRKLLDLTVNSRIQSIRHARERYRKMAERKFDFVVGNPPWGGILKGRLAPIFDEHYKKQLEGEYPDTYTGKLDIYGLFYDRGLSFLKPGGTLALVSQGSFIDKEWAGPHAEQVRRERIEIKGLRRKLAEEATLRYLIDLNPFGQLFFGAMNIPCIAVFEKRAPYQDEKAVVLLSSKKSWPKALSRAGRRTEVATMVRRSLGLVEKSSEPLKQDFISAFAFPVARLREFRGSRWLLAPKEFRIHSRPDWPTVVSLLEPSQGVTVGGEGGLEVFLMPEARAKELKLEEELVRQIIKGHETSRWRIQWEGKVILYPYHRDKNEHWVPAFSVEKPPLDDSLNFETDVDKVERDYFRAYGHNVSVYKLLLEHRRDALGIVKYPRAADYLMKFYEKLSGRTFEKKNIFDCGKQWYEFHRQRDADIIFGKPKIVSPRLTPRVRFALDQEGIGIQDSCLCLAVSENTKEAFNDFRKKLGSLLGHDVKTVTVFRYLLAFLNSTYAQELLTTGHRPRPGDVFQISDEFIGELSIPLCRRKRELQTLLDGVESCLLAQSDDVLREAESRLDALVLSLYAD